MKYRGADFLLQVLADDNITWLSATSDRSTSVSVGNEFVDVTAKGDGAWRQGKAVGVRTADVSCSGLVVDGDGAYSKLMARSFDGVAIRARVIHATAQDVLFDGRFIVGALERSGEYNNAEQYSVTLSSAVTLVVSLPSVAIVESSSTGYTPLIVSFTANVTGGTAPYTYDWDFGDGSAHSTLANPTHTYTEAGETFTVTLTVTDAVGSVSVMTSTITTPGTAGGASVEWNPVLAQDPPPRARSVAFTTRTNLS